MTNRFAEKISTTLKRLTEFLFSPSIRQIVRMLRAYRYGYVLVLAIPSTAQLMSVPLHHNGYDRPYLVYRPTHLAPHPAAVFMLGGITSTAHSASDDFGWARLADKDGFLVIYPEPMRTDLTRPAEGRKNITFWEMQGSRTHILAPGAAPVDDDGYLAAVVRDVVRRTHADRKRIYFAGFSSGSGMAQLFASRHSKLVSGVVAVATPLMEPPVSLARPVPILYIHGDEDEQFTAFEKNSPHFVTTPHGNWVTWGYLNHCRQQFAEKMPWGIQLRWQGCAKDVPIIADFVAGIGHSWEGSADSKHDQGKPSPSPLNFTTMAWEFFKQIARR